MPKFFSTLYVEHLLNMTPKVGVVALFCILLCVFLGILNGIFSPMPRDFLYYGDMSHGLWLLLLAGSLFAILVAWRVALRGWRDNVRYASHSVLLDLRARPKGLAAFVFCLPLNIWGSKKFDQNVSFGKSNHRRKGPFSILQETVFLRPSWSMPL